MKRLDDRAEWIEPDGLGGFASGTAAGIRSRRYHALLLAATTPPTGRVVLVNGCEAWVETPAGSFALSSQRYVPDVQHPDGARRIASFTTDPWPTWTFALEDGTTISQEILVPPGRAETLVRWRLLGGAPGATLRVRPLLSGRDYHALHRENPAFRFDAEQEHRRVIWRPYADLPPVAAASNAEYEHQPEWYRNFLYREEQARGLDCVEDLASPGVFTWDLSSADAYLVLSTDPAGREDAADYGAQMFADERRRRGNYESALHRAADAYLVRRGAGWTLIAGYPWFTDWGRDTFIALPGLCLTTGRLDRARDILLEWAGAVSEGMLPNRFADRGEVPEFNAVDASLWYVVAARLFLDEAARRAFALTDAERHRLEGAILAIVEGYARGTRHGIRMDDDALLSAGVPGLQLTWMDAKVGDTVITPRIGKPVEVQALWVNALAAAALVDARWDALMRRAVESFNARFWNEERGCLFDVVDADHQRGRNDNSIRPNQILAVGGLPVALVDGARARRIVDVVERELVTPLGLRSLGRSEPGYVGRYGGSVADRDGGYHQGTVWPWLIAPFIDAWLQTRTSIEALDPTHFLAGLKAHLDEAGLGHVSEVADGDAPHSPGGCPFQAWSLAAVLQAAHRLQLSAFA